jgi:hypothetical protein
MVMISTAPMAMAMTVKRSIWLKSACLGHNGWDTAGFSVPGASDLGFCETCPLDNSGQKVDRPAQLLSAHLRDECQRAG